MFQLCSVVFKLDTIEFELGIWHCHGSTWTDADKFKLCYVFLSVESLFFESWNNMFSIFFFFLCFPILKNFNWLKFNYFTTGLFSERKSECLCGGPSACTSRLLTDRLLIAYLNCCRIKVTEARFSLLVPRNRSALTTSTWLIWYFAGLKIMFNY